MKPLCADCNIRRAHSRGYCRCCYRVRWTAKRFDGPKPVTRPAHQPKQEQPIAIVNDKTIEDARRAYNCAANLQARIFWANEIRRLTAC